MHFEVNSNKGVEGFVINRNYKINKKKRVEIMDFQKATFNAFIEEMNEKVDRKKVKCQL